MSGSRRRALSIRRDQQRNRPPGPTSPLEVNVTMPTDGKWEPTITASPIQPHQNLQIPITPHWCPAGSCLGGFRTPAPCPDARPAVAGVRKPSPSRSLSRSGSFLESGRKWCRGASDGRWREAVVPFGARAGRILHTPFLCSRRDPFCGFRQSPTAAALIPTRLATITALISTGWSAGN